MVWVYWIQAKKNGYKYGENVNKVCQVTNQSYSFNWLCVYYPDNSLHYTYLYYPDHILHYIYLNTLSFSHSLQFNKH